MGQGKERQGEERQGEARTRRVCNYTLDKAFVLPVPAAELRVSSFDSLWPLPCWSCALPRLGCCCCEVNRCPSASSGIHPWCGVEAGLGRACVVGTNVHTNEPRNLRIHTRMCLHKVCTDMYCGREGGKDRPTRQGCRNGSWRRGCGQSVKSSTSN